MTKNKINLKNVFYSMAAASMIMLATMPLTAGAQQPDASDRSTEKSVTDPYGY